MELGEYIGNRIRDLRLEYGAGEGISQEALAKALDVATNTISRWETGTYQPKLQDIEKLSRFFDVSILEFFPHQDAPKDNKLTALLRAATQLSPEDVEELHKYAEFRHARSLYKSGRKPHPGRARKDKKK